MGPELIVQRPAWLADGQRGRGVPEQMRWRPLITFIQTAMDAANAMVSVPGEFGSFGHDYRADMVRFVRDAYALPAASDAQVARIEAVLRSLELERAARIKAQHGHAAPPAPAHRAAGDAVQAGVPLRQRRTSGARWLRGRQRGPHPAHRLMPTVRLRESVTDDDRRAVLGLRRGPGQDRYLGSMEGPRMPTPSRGRSRGCGRSMTATSSWAS